MPTWSTARIKRRELLTVGIISLVAAVAISIFNVSVQFSVNARRGGAVLQTNSLSMIEDRSILRKHHAEVEGLHPDGTYLLYHDIHNRGPNDNCMDVINEKEHIMRIHYHYSTCSAFDRQFGNRLAVIYGMKMIAHALGVPFKFTCGVSEGEAANGVAFLVPMVNDDGVGVLPDVDGQLSAEDICLRCGGLFCSWYNADLALAAGFMESDWSYLTRSELNFVPFADHDDAVIHLRLGDV